MIRPVVAKLLRGVSAQRLIPRTEKGRTAAYGVLIPDEEMRDAIATGRDVLVRKTPLPESCRTLAEDLQELVDKGIVAPHAAEAVFSDL